MRFNWNNADFYFNILLRKTPLSSSSDFFFFYYTFIHLFRRKYYTSNVSLTHVASFRPMTPKPVGLRAMGVKTPLRA